MKRMLLQTMGTYDTVLKMRVLPWAHPVLGWVGYAYIHDDGAGWLVYFVPTFGGNEIHVHQTTFRFEPDDAVIGGYVPTTTPDPDTDPQVAKFTFPAF